ncbi:MAG: isoleucine--tRNA ligase [Planctomycetota bacterium]|jgi:isoleucyl-tRNA synthetase
MFGTIDTKPNYPEMEHRILTFWEEKRIFDALRKKNKDGPRFRFLDGPITANNPMGVHHAWGRTYKDVFQRYRAMNGHHMRFQNGFDCQGLWVEVEVEKELGFQSKKDIEKFGIAEFVEKCKERVRKYSEMQTQQSIRLGYWMDWSNSYYTMSEENNYTIWHFLKKCFEAGWIYKGEDSMPWCPRCGTGISQMEMHEGYRFVADRALFVRFRLKEREEEAYLLVWTTTPWTLTSNVAAAVNPEQTYVRVKHNDAFYYLAEEALHFKRKEEDFEKGPWIEGVPALESPAEIFEKAGGYEVVESLPGEQMLGWTYEGPFDDLPAQANPGGFPPSSREAVKAETGITGHRVIAWELVGGTEGTGIVHIAPGCGKEDYELGKAEGLVAIAPLTESGDYAEGFDWLTGLSVIEKETTERILADLETRGVLVAAEDYPHSYPHCWRCSTQLVFRMVDEWYIRMDELRHKIMAVARKIRWMPAFGLDQELDWLTNMRDWMITKKRFWGLALPIYPCEHCGHFEVIGSKEELQARAVKGWEAFEGHSPHRPWIDEVKIACAKCGEEVSRLSDVGTPWLDAGIVPFSTVHYLTKNDVWKAWFPFEFITECFPGQFRNWFYALLAMSTVLENREPFQTVLGHALVRDENGEDMHKSLGNVIWFHDAAEKMGVDLMRWIFAKQNPYQNLNFGYAAGEQVKRKMLTLWNLCSFFTTYAALDMPDLSQPLSPKEDLALLDRWLLTRLQRLVRIARKAYEEYELPPLARDVESFLDEMSNWYVRRSRRRFWKGTDDQDKHNAYRTLFTALSTLTAVVAPVLPFTAEEIFQKVLRPVVKDAPLSVHLTAFPAVEEGFIDENLEAEMERVMQLVNMALGARAAANMKIRQPLADARFALPGARERETLAKYAGVIAEEVNVKSVSFVDSNEDQVEHGIRPKLSILGRRFGKRTQAVKGALQAVDPNAARAALAENVPLRIQVEGEAGEMETLEIPPDAFELRTAGKEGWHVLLEGDISVALDLRLTDALILEGRARDLVRHIQNHRKSAGLEVADRIHITFNADSPLAEAMQKEDDYIMGEVLALSLQAVKKPKGEYTAELKIGGETLKIALRKAESEGE